MILDVPYFHQQTKYSCGPASIRMILASFGIKKTERQISKRVLVTKKYGTSRKNVLRLLSSFGIRYHVMSSASLKEVESHLRLGHLVVINYLDLPPDPEDHYALIVGLTARNVILNDPFWGKKYAIEKKFFLSRWKNKKLKKKYTGWMVAIRKK